MILWYGWNAAEILLTRRVAWYLQSNVNIKVSEVVLQVSPKESFQSSISMIPPKELLQLYHTMKPVSTNTLKLWAQEWDIISNISDCIRIWLNNKLESVQETFFDDALLDSIGDYWVLSTRVGR
ncbi:MAG: DUF3658 domain-containing protein [Rickettsia endosymbiont of Ixodes persulcatus]|nr:DUF3658 domain-containing protein [Rickettsia endosymbiont of Ixodes persulcatus]MCZ6902563.1 DUF3658 domain-containing protein [Rickettsia endosymbiont of Ixodes persulcatus]MCZ6903218.1 DUF3658 domain-containing protein [Rickettsia endosymbiont of Ixodes persulcatus]MCZ6908512.1 DUF3658 domain-containing protein [Rickettsia endosymbiont of Ixodes persulcatus]MCZ6913492.1 DUF3658 domain-containing protein [Rickettsia endosymbiont of Ixodes persulcatus]